jgi:hypothetical protein
MIDAKNKTVIQSMHYLHKSGSHGDITDLDRAEMGLALLRDARELFKAADNKRTAARISAAISSARGAVRIQGYRETRKSEGNSTNS